MLVLRVPRDPWHGCVMHHTGMVIQATRKAQGLTLRQLASLADVDHTMLSRVERGLVDPSPRWLKAVTAALGAHMAAITEGDDAA